MIEGEEGREERSGKTEEADDRKCEKEGERNGRNTKQNASRW